MRNLLAVLVVVLLVAGCSTRPQLAVTHSPDPCNIHESQMFPTNPFPYMWYYRTEVENTGTRPLQITTFESYLLVDGEWIPRNVLRRELTSQDFDNWYSDGASVSNGWIQPGQVAVCDPNWHGLTTNMPLLCKWVFEGKDSDGNPCRVEAQIESLAITE